jgi:phosphonopyruvate decarboxylase
MIEAKDFVEELMKNNLGPVIEVPCTIFGPVVNYMVDKKIPLETPANEAVAMGLAAGHYLATGKIPVVMMQNSGLCNSLNALTSLHGIYDIPALLVVTWRGEPGTKDAPEHLIIGAKLGGLLKVLNLPYKILTPKGYRAEIKEMAEKAEATKRPTVLILRKGVINEYKGTKKDTGAPLDMREAITIIKGAMGSEVIYVSTTGYISRISFNVNDTPDFYMVGSMGHALPIGLGAALETNKRVVVLDGDGGCLMHAGAMASVGAEKPKNLIHIVLDNRAHVSTGAQPSLSPSVDFSELAGGFGYKNTFTVGTASELKSAVERARKTDGPTFINVTINQNVPPENEMKRVSGTYTCSEIKKRFMKNV